MAAKARPSDARPGRQLWLKDHGQWIPVRVTQGARGLKVHFINAQGHPGQHLIDALYRTPNSDHSPLS